MAKKKRGRPRKLVSEMNPQVQIGRHPQEEIDLIDAAAQQSGAESRSAWAWPILVRAAKRVLAKKGKI